MTSRRNFLEKLKNKKSYNIWAALYFQLPPMQRENKSRRCRKIKSLALGTPRYRGHLLNYNVMEISQWEAENLYYHVQKGQYNKVAH